MGKRFNRQNTSKILKARRFAKKNKFSSPTEAQRKLSRMALKTDFGILYYEDRRPPYRKLETVIQPSLVGSWGC